MNEPVAEEPAGEELVAEIALSATSASFAATAGGADPSPTSVTITNAGTGTLSSLSVNVTYVPGKPEGWLSRTLTSQTAPSTLELIPHTGSLPAGTHTATVMIASAGASNSPRTISVSFTIEAASVPTIALSASMATFIATTGGPDPAEQVIAITNSGEGTLSGLAASITYDAGEPEGWLTLLMSSATAPTTLTLGAEVGALPEGVYHATATIASPVAVDEPDVRATLIVSDERSPEIVLSQTSLAFTAAQGGLSRPFRYLVLISNGGTGTLSDLAAAVSYEAGQPTGWLTPLLSTPMGSPMLDIRAASGALAVGTYDATVSVASPVATNSPQTITVTLTVTPSSPPTISLSDASVSFTATQGTGDPAVQIVQILNGGGEVLSGLGTAVTYQAGQPTDWLTAALGGTTAPATLSLDATTGALAAGTYHATVSITSAVAMNSPQLLDVTFTVTAPPSITLTPPTTVSFTLADGVSSDGEEVAVTNGGGGTLSGLTAIITYTSAGGWLEADLSSTTAPATLTLTASRGVLAAGTYQAVVLVGAANLGTLPLPVQLTVEAAQDPPEIAVSVTQRTFSAMEGDAAPLILQAQVGNAGGGSLTGLLAVESPAVGWLGVSLSSTAAPATITFTATPSGLAAGTYSTTVEVSSPVAGNSPQSVAVTLTVEPQPAEPTTLVIINDLYGQVAGSNDWGKMNTVVRLRIGPTESSVINFDGGAQGLLYPWDSTSDVGNTLRIAPGTQMSFDVSSWNGPYWLYIQNGWWEFFSEFGSWEKHMTGVVGCDGVTTVYKGTIIQIIEPFGDPEVIRLSDWLPAGNYYRSPFCQ